MTTRRCTVCGDPYYRRNQTEIWMGRNPGHRGGWQKLYIRICNKCLSVDQAQQMLYQANVRAVRKGRTYRAVPMKIRIAQPKQGERRERARVLA